MDVDAIRRELVLLEREIAVIKYELSEARRDSVRAALRQELEEKEAERSNLSHQFNITIGDDNNFSHANQAFGVQVGRDLNQSNETNTINASGTFGDGNYIAGRDVHIIYPDTQTFKNIVPIEFRLKYQAILSKRTESYSITKGKWIFKQDTTAIKDHWDATAPFQIIAEIRDTVTSKVKESILYSGHLDLVNSVVPYSNITPTSPLLMLYMADKNSSNASAQRIADFLNQLGKDGYDVDDEIIGYNGTVYSERGSIVGIKVYSERYSSEGLDASATYREKTYTEEFREKDGVYTGQIFYKILKRRKS